MVDEEAFPPTSPDEDGAGDPSVSEVFAAFLTRRVLDGDSVSVEELCRKHPEHAEELRRLQASLEASGDDGDPTDVASRAKAQDEFASTVLSRLSGREGNYGRYKLKGEIARGGQGAIVRVWDEDLNRHLAMKIVLGRVERPDGVSTPPLDSRSLGRFLEEAQVTGQLDHPGIVPVHELGLDPEGRVYFTMKLVKGRDLRRIIDHVHEGTEGWNLTRALGAMLKVCEAMSYAHAKGVIHRDLKPGNVMVGRYGEVFVMDWGLARVLGRDDHKDIRVQPQSVSMTTEVHSPRQGHGSDSAESPLFTMDGDIVGTPAYMSPEQAMGDVEGMGPHSDVYSVGAMLYHLLSGRVPYVPPGGRINNYAVWALVQTGPPFSLTQVAPEVPGELVAICEKAMGRDVRDRYADMQELADDLRAYLEHRVVQAYRTGALVEFRKWVERNRGLASMSAAALILLVAGLGAVSWVEARGRAAAEAERQIAIANEGLAKENEAEARRQEGFATRERANVMRLSAFQKLEDLTTEADELWPMHPDRVPEYESWLGRADELMGERVFAVAQRDELRARALPMSPEDRRGHPRFPELEALRRKRAALDLAGAVRSGRTTPASFSLDEERLPREAQRLNTLAWPLVDPLRTTFGREAEGLALAQLAYERAVDDTERMRIGYTLAWAFFANGLDEEALGAAYQAKDDASSALFGESETKFVKLETAVLAAEEEVAAEREELRREISALEEIVAERHVWTFANDEDRWWHAQLTKLIAELDAFADEETGLIRGVSPEHNWGIERRLALARGVEARTVTGPEARAAWDDAIRSIRNREECPRYDGLELTPQLGLFPVGIEERTGLWEFVDVRTGAVPERDLEGDLVLPPDVGIVFVLVPGGTFWMGAQASDPSGPNYDPAAIPGEGPVHQVTLDPYFLSKYELTQRQWAGFTGENPSTYSTERYWGERHPSDLHPVEQVTWLECSRMLSRLGLILPTEAQWEYAARAGTQTVWFSGQEPESLRGYANVADLAAMRWGAGWPRFEEWLDDGHPVHTHAATYPANAFGFHEIIGNIAEWCRELWGDYSLPFRPGDGERQVTAGTAHIPRGGSFAFPAGQTRSASRLSWEENYRSNFIGVRPARSLEY